VALAVVAAVAAVAEAAAIAVARRRHQERLALLPQVEPQLLRRLVVQHLRELLRHEALVLLLLLPKLQPQRAVAHRRRMPRLQPPRPDAASERALTGPKASWTTTFLMSS
jgi:hypothetical protein